MSSASDLAEARQATVESWSAALHLVRETVETLGRAGILPSRATLIQLYGPEPVHEATALAAAIRTMVR